MKEKAARKQKMPKDTEAGIFHSQMVMDWSKTTRFWRQWSANSSRKGSTHPGTSILSQHGHAKQWLEEMSCSRQAQGDSRTAWDKAKEWIKKIFNRIKTAWDKAKEWIKMMFNAIRKRETEKTNKALECKIDAAFQDLNNKMKALHENFKNLESKEREEIREELEKIPEEEIARTLEAKLNTSLRQLSRRIRTLQEDVQEWPEAIKDELQLFRAELEMKTGNKEEEIARSLEAKLNTRFRELSQRIQTLQADVEEWPETIKDELQLFRAELKKNSGNKEEEIARTLESVLKTFWQLFQGIQIVENLKKAIKHEFLRRSA